MTQPLTGHSLPLPEARALARQRGLRERALAYVTRNGELLVFEHTPEYPDAGVQVPAGGLETGETSAEAAVRETREETGLELSGPAHLASFPWSKGELAEVWHVFHLSAPPDTPDAWAHRVTHGGGDAGLTFLCRFAPLGASSLTPGDGHDAALPELTRHLHLPPMELSHD
ncbi:NUDIX hydrolase [Deinococcus planocerae]|uniref:NUDIX hydrolase n=1 Tax=Deinococcus planocerae TaxID=1737569 RepID=UPI001FE9D4BE|nr:NUDIX domain-containing protein [Deinococcus planocerae]